MKTDSKLSKLEELKQTNWNQTNWKAENILSVTNLESLKEYLPLEAKEQAQLERVIQMHPMNIPRYYLSLIDPDDPHDPIRRLCVPSAQELTRTGGMGETTKDPYGDDKHDMGNGVLHKYAYTALVVSTEYCSMYCRHCFRKRLVGLPNDKTVENFAKAADYVRRHPEITNLVISGGDALMLPTKILKSMLDQLKDIDHLNYVRIGSRVPVSNPVRLLDDDLIQVLADFNQAKTLYLPTHFNHAQEISPFAAQMVQRLRQAGITLNNQAVLLQGVNDSPQALVDLMQGLTRIGIMPYYLYQCMPVERVRSHFQIPLKRAIDLVGQAKAELDGYAKRFKFILGHDIGKIEVVGRQGDLGVFSQIHARQENPEEASRVFFAKLDDEGGWLDDFEILEAESLMA